MRLLEFTASWCQPCKVQKPIVEAWAKEQSGLELEIIDVDKANGAELASKYYVKAVPSLVFVDDSGNALAASSGVAKKEKLTELHQQAVRFAQSKR